VDHDCVSVSVHPSHSSTIRYPPQVVAVWSCWLQLWSV
jgi:hypothetical protein